MIVHGVHDATTNPAKIRSWAAAWPDGNVGVATGAPGPTVLDIDDLAAGAELVEKCKRLGVPHVATGRGLQFFFRGEDGRTVGLGFGELRGQGSYVVTPPSIHPTGKTYTWLLSPNGALPHLPDGLIPERSGAGAGDAEGCERVPPGSMYQYLVDRAVRLARAGERDVDVVAKALCAAFELKRDPGKTYNGTAADTRRISEWAVQSEIAGRERVRDSSRFSKYRHSRRRSSDDEPDATGPKLRVLDVETMLKTTPPPVAWLVDPILARACTTMLAGREGRGKSLLALALAAAGGRAGTIAGMVCPEPLKTLYVDAENGEQEAHRRLHGLNVPAGALVYVEADGFSLRHDFDELAALVEANAPDVLVLDSLRSLAPGLDENDSQQTEVALRPVVRLTQQRRIASLVLHHASRASGEYRGSTAIGAAVELGFTLSRHDDDPDARRRRKLSCWKSRPAAEPPVRWVAIEPVPGGGILLAETEPFEPERPRPRDNRRESVLAALGDEPVSERDVVAAAGVPKTTARRVLLDLQDAGLAERTDDGWVVHRSTGPRGVDHVDHSPERPRREPTCLDPEHRGPDWAPSNGTVWVCGVCHPAPSVAAIARRHPDAG